MQKDAALVSPGFWRGVSGCGNRGEFRVSCLRVMGGAGGLVWRIPTRALGCVGPARFVRISCLASGMQKGQVKGAESGNIGTGTSCGGRKRYSEQRLWFI